jgi:hypothetical protein
MVNVGSSSELYFGKETENYTCHLFHITKLMMEIIFVNTEAKTSLHKTKHIIVNVFLIFKGTESFNYLLYNILLPLIFHTEQKSSLLQ